MLTRNALAQLERSLRGTRVLSVYLDRSTQDFANRDAWRLTLDNLIDEQRDALGAHASHEERAAFDACVARLRERLAEPEPVAAPPGWVGLFPAAGEPYVEALPVQMPTLVAWGDGARVAPCIRALKQHIPAIVAIVDSREADLYVYARGTLERADRIRATVRGFDAAHMGNPPRQGFHTGTRGTAGADEAQTKRRAGTEALVRELVSQLEMLAGSRAWILVGGIPDVAAEVVNALPERLLQRARKLRGVDVHASVAEIEEAAEHVATAASRERDLAHVLDLIDREAASGRGVSGYQRTREALAEHAGDTLFMTGRFIGEHAAEAEELARLAFAEAADLEYVSAAAAERLDQAGGVGALLRFVPVRGQQPLAAAPQPATR